MSVSIEEAQIPQRRPKPTPNTPENVLQQFSLKGKVCVVTGAAAGLGLATVQAFAEAGADVCLWYNSHHRGLTEANSYAAVDLKCLYADLALNTVAVQRAEEIAKLHGVRAKAYQAEITDCEAVRETVQQVVADFGRLDVFVANAGTAISKGILDMSIAEYKRLMEVNVDGVFYCAKYAGEIFKKQRTGNLIITSSISAHIVNIPIDQPVYNASKACVEHLGKSLAREWREFARVNIVAPGFFDTAMGPSPKVESEAYRMAVLGRKGDVREIKGLYLYLASDASSYQTGSVSVIDGGYELP